MGADGQKDGIEPLLLEIRQAEITSEPFSGLNHNSVAQEVSDLMVQGIGRQAIVRYPDPEHAAQHLKRLENGNLVPLQPQVVGHRQSSRAGTDHRDLFLALGDVRQR